MRGSTFLYDPYLTEFLLLDSPFVNSVKEIISSLYPTETVDFIEVVL